MGIGCDDRISGGVVVGLGGVESGLAGKQVYFHVNYWFANTVDCYISANIMQKFHIYFQLQWKSDDEFVGAAAVDTFCYVVHMNMMLWYTGMERKIAVHSQVLIFNFFLVVDPFLWDYGFGVSIVAVAAGCLFSPSSSYKLRCSGCHSTKKVKWLELWEFLIYEIASQSLTLPSFGSSDTGFCIMICAPQTFLCIFEYIEHAYGVLEFQLRKERKGGKSTEFHFHILQLRFVSYKYEGHLARLIHCRVSRT
ncbi:unnamed protein product [Amaranthus hypochondriacus]